MNPHNTIYMYPLKTIENFQKKFLTAVDECGMIIVPLQEGSFFAPENRLLRRGRPGSVSGCLIDPIYRAKYSENGGAAHGC